MLGAIPVIGLVALGRGDVDEARRWLGDALAAGRELDDVELILPPLWGLAEVSLVAEDPATALALSTEALELARRTGERPLFVPFVVTGARAAIAVRRPEEAERWLDLVRAHLAGWAMAEAALAHAEGLVQLATGKLTAARASLAVAVEGWQGRGRIWEASWARLDLAQCLLRSNRHGEMAAVWGQVLDAARTMGSQPLLSRAEELRRQGRGHIANDEAWRPLTAREFEVARLIAQGLTNGQIAEELVLSPKTVSAHVEHILAKLAVARRAEIAAWTATIDRAQASASPRGAVPVR